MQMFDHIGLKVENLDVSARFYVEAVCLGEDK
jgi:hypothetical protein